MNKPRAPLFRRNWIGTIRRVRGDARKIVDLSLLVVGRRKDGFQLHAPVCAHLMGSDLARNQDPFPLPKAPLVFNLRFKTTHEQPRHVVGRVVMNGCGPESKCSDIWAGCLSRGTALAFTLLGTFCKFVIILTTHDSA